MMDRKPRKFAATDCRLMNNFAELAVSPDIMLTYDFFRFTPTHSHARAKVWQKSMLVFARLTGICMHGYHVPRTTLTCGCLRLIQWHTLNALSKTGGQI
jgi:hypothetical protein